jgi:hypothetical protein
LGHDDSGGRSQSSYTLDRGEAEPTGALVTIRGIDVLFTTTLTQLLKRSARAAILAGVLLVTLAPAEARAVTPCWKQLINDWYDTTIDRSYPIPCYRQAIDHLPTDAQLYSSAKDDILRAMQRQIALEKQATQPTTTEAPPTTTTAAATTTEATSTEATAPPPEPTTTEEAAVPPTTTSPGRDKPKGVARALDKLNPGDADSFPLPLLILGALAILLVAAGVIGMIWRRMDRGGPDPDAGAGPV